jgi:hypothetical protein
MVNSFFEVRLMRAKDVLEETPAVFPVNNPQIYLGEGKCITLRLTPKELPICRNDKVRATPDGVWREDALSPPDKSGGYSQISPTDLRKNLLQYLIIHNL